MERVPLFSVIIPVFNAENTIEVSILSVLNQTCEDWELIVINDGSNDSSLDIIEKIIADYPNKPVRLINQKNLGAGKTRNNGIELASGEFIAFLDSDDYWDNRLLEETKKYIVNDRAEIIFLDIVREKQDGTVIRYEKMSQYRNFEKDRMIRWQLTGKIPWGGVRKIIKRNILIEHDIRYATSIKVGEESVYSYQALFYSNTVSFLSNVFYHYVDNSSSLTAHDTVSNSINVYKYVRDNIRNGVIEKQYEDTVKALALTTMAIVTNVLAQQYSTMKACIEANKIYKEYKMDYKGHLNKDSLEKRVRICMPWIKLGFSLPVVLAGKLQRSLRRKCCERV